MCNLFITNKVFNFLSSDFYLVSSQSMRSRQALAQVQQRILHSIQTSHEFKQKRQHPIQNPQIEVAVALHFIHLLEVATASRSILGSTCTSKSIFTRELLDVEGVLSVLLSSIIVYTIMVYLYKLIFRDCTNPLFQTVKYMGSKPLILCVV
jgi:hypothetical protein